MAHTPESRRRALEKRTQTRADWIQENGPCQICSSSDNLEVDHIDPSTKISHNIWTWTLLRRTEELTKCQVLCRPCHILKTAQENSIRMGGLHHGTQTMYGKHKCRCVPCTTTWNEAKARNRARRQYLGLPRQ